MYRLLLFAFLCLPGLTAWGQAVFRIDSLPTNGVILDKNWKWHLGDNPAWAKADLDDASWDTLTPTQDVAILTNIPTQGIGWLRLHLQASPQLQGKIMYINLSQAGASDMFLNGQLFFQNGKISPQKRLEKGALTQYVPIVLFGPDSVHTLAVRFAFDKTKLLSDSDPFSLIRLQKPEVVKANREWLEKDLVSHALLFGVFFILGTLQLILYSRAPAQKSSLYFGMFLVAQCLTHYSIVSMLSPDSLPFTPPFRNALVFVDSFTILFIAGVVASALFYLLGIYYYFKQPKRLLFWLTASLTLSALPLYLVDRVYFGSDIRFVAQFILGCIVPWLDILRIGILAIKQKKQGANLFVTAHSTLLLTFIILFFVPIWLPSLSLPVNGYTLMLLVFLSLAMTITFLLSQEQVNTNRLLAKQLVDLEVLSETMLAQEQEKQQLLATQNDRLEQQVEVRTAELKASQTQLIQKEKLASLGELTAGIAHEIQNPLNFVNNFSEVSTELIAELKEGPFQQLPDTEKEYAGEILGDLTQNLQKITHHGGRASSIVKGMLEHSRTSAGEPQPTLLNALADEYLQLAYQGMRAKDKAFNCELITEFDPQLGQVEVVPQEIGRVLLNLYNNAFYAVHVKAKTATNYQPRVEVSTKREGQQVILQVGDNGTGMPESVKAKIFQPFFTTKPTGEGTGLGLSLSYDIVTKGHGGSLIVESQEGLGTAFTLQLQRASEI